MTTMLNRPMTEEIRLAHRAVIAGELAVLMELNAPTHPEHLTRLCSAYWSRATALRQLAEASWGTAPETARRSMVASANADARRARELMRQIGLTR